jgi:hypothetical protein
MTAEPATNWYGTRRHYSTDLAQNSLNHKGRQGHSLCSTENNPVQVWDQDGMDGNAERYSTKSTVVAGLPECKKCVRKLNVQDENR